MKEQKWKNKTNRFILFFDILGFKDMVSRSNHDNIFKKLNALKRTSDYLEALPDSGEKPKSVKTIEKNQTRNITFSDSIIFFSKGDTYLDARKILIDAYLILDTAFRNSIHIKGAISYGLITADFDNSLFFGQPIIDAFLLHEELNLLSVVIDHNAEMKFSSLGKKADNYNVLKDYKVPMKYGKVNHKLVCFNNKKHLTTGIEYLKKLYLLTSGRPRIYIDNTIELLNWRLKEETDSNKK